MYILLCFTAAITIVCTQFVQYPYYQGYYSSPCRSSCGNSQPISYCQNFPCYGQRTPYSLPFNTRSFPLNQGVGYNYPYAYQFQQYPVKTSNTNSYSNIPTEMIDESNLGTIMGGQANINQQLYGNVPTEVIDENQFNSFVKNFAKNIPKLPKVTQTSYSNYTVVQGGATSSSTNKLKPVKAVISRSFQPQKQNPIINLNFVNGQAVDDKPSTEKRAEVRSSTTETTTTEIDENVSGVESWISS